MRERRALETLLNKLMSYFSPLRILETEITDKIHNLFLHTRIGGNEKTLALRKFNTFRGSIYLINFKTEKNQPVMFTSHANRFLTFLFTTAKFVEISS